MTVISPPIFLQAGAHPAESVRQMMGALFGTTLSSFAGGVGAFDPGHGVARPTHLEVSQQGTPGMGVSVVGGGAFIRGSSAAAQGCYFFYNDGIVSLSVGAADPTNARRDLVVAQVRDSSYIGSDNDARLFVVQGTAAAVPVDPTVPADCLVLARVAVAANASSIVNADITDTRTLARPFNTAWGRVGYGERTTSLTLTTSYVTIAEISVPMILGRRYELGGWGSGVEGVSSASVTGWGLAITDGSNTVLREGYGAAQLNLLGSAIYLQLQYEPASTTSFTFRLRAKSYGASNGSLTSNTTPTRAHLIVRDIGPV